MNLKHSTKKFTIFLNGTKSQSHIEVIADKLKSSTLSNLNENEIFIADGGLNHFLKNKITSKKIFWAGDYDSLIEKSKKFLDKNSMRNKMKAEKEIIIEEISLQKNKNYNDFSVLLDQISKRSTNNSVYLEVFFGLGGRKDHELANILEAQRFIKNHSAGGICYFHEGVIISSINFEVNNASNIRFSIFSDDNKVPITIRGAQYSGSIVLERPSHGLSNVAKGSRIFIQPHSSTILFYF